MMKRFVSILLSVALLCTVFAVTVNAADNPSFELVDAEGSIGDTVDVKLYIKNNPGIASLQVLVNYSSNDLELVNIANGGVFDSAISKSSVDKKPAIISWFSADSENKTDNGLLAILYFEIKEGAKDSKVSLSYDEENVFNSSFENVKFDTDTAKVTVAKSAEPTKATEPVTNTQITEPATEKPTKPVATEPQPTTPKPTAPVVKPSTKKKNNTVKVTVKTKTVKLKNLKKKAQKVKPITIKSAKGKVIIKLTSAKKTIKKYLKFDSKGNLTIKKWKKAKKGTYTIKVKITAKGNSKYKPKNINKTVKIKIK